MSDEDLLQVGRAGVNLMSESTGHGIRRAQPGTAVRFFGGVTKG